MCRSQVHHYSSVERSIRRDDPHFVRVGDRERDEATTTLSEHFALGRLDRDEFSARLDAALSARTRGDLDRLFVDLPRARSRRTTRRDRSRAVGPAIGALLTLALVVASIGAVAHGFPPFFLFALFFVWRGHRHAW